MPLIGGSLGYHLLHASKRLIEWHHGGPSPLMDGSAYYDKSKIEVLLGSDIWQQIQDKSVIDFGCREGAEAVEMAQRGAKEVLGIDVVDSYLETATKRASGVPNCRFAKTADIKADVIVSLDAFEHYNDPDQILVLMGQLLNPKGTVLCSFGPTWYHPLGGHYFSPFPWAHLIFTEQSLLRWRNSIENETNKKFSDVRGGLNQMTIKRFERLVSESPFQISKLECVPIRKLQPLANRITREFTTAIVRGTLTLRNT